MKKFTFTAIIIMLIAACASETDGTIVFDMVRANKEVELSNDEGTPVCAVHLQLPYATEKNGKKAQVVNEAIMKRLLDMEDLTMQQAVDSFASNYTRTYVRNFLPLYNEDRADTSKRSWYEYHYVITSEAHQASQKTSVAIAIIDYFEGGARSVNQELTLNFDNETGELIELNQLFVPGYESQLCPILQKALQEKVGVNSLKELKAHGYLQETDMYASKNFILNDETITFIYNPSEIASQDKGLTELTIARKALTNILKFEHKL